MNKIECKVCGTKFLPKKENRYTANSPKDMSIFLNSGEYDCFDCIKCGCQIVVGKRYARQFPQHLGFIPKDCNLPAKVVNGGKEAYFNYEVKNDT